MFKKYKKLISIIIAVLMLSVSFGTATSVKASTASNDIVYVALGDSVAAGMSATTIDKSYTELLKTYLDGNPRVGSTVYSNLSVIGLTAEGLYNQVTNNDYTGTIAKADIITINIGGNNILGAVIGAVKLLYGEVAAAYGYNLNTLQGLNDAINTHPELVTYMMGQLENPYSAESIALNGALMKGVASFNYHYPLLMKEVRTLAPKAEIYVNTLYSPVSEDEDLAMLLNPYIHSINLAIRGYQFRYQYKVVDVYSAFRFTSKNVLDFNINITGSTPLNVDIHPNDVGHRLIFNTLKLRLWSSRSKYYYR